MRHGLLVPAGLRLKRQHHLEVPGSPGGSGTQSADDRHNRPAVFSGKFRDSERSLASARLSVETAFSCDHQISVPDCLFKAQQIGNQAEARQQCRSAKRRHSEPQAAGRSGAGRIPEIAAERSGCHVRQITKPAFQAESFLLPAQPFLRSNDTR